MKCPIDQTEMKKGILFNNGTAWSQRVNDTILKIASNIAMAKMLYAYGCLKCGKVELTTEAEK